MGALVGKERKNGGSNAGGRVEALNREKKRVHMVCEDGKGGGQGGERGS